MIFSDPKGIVESFVSLFPTANYDLDLLFYIFRIKNIPPPPPVKNEKLTSCKDFISCIQLLKSTAHVHDLCKEITMILL